MSVSSVSAATSPAPTVASRLAASVARAADGDYKTPNALSSRTKDGDGDYKALASSAANSSSAVQAKLAALKTGG